jgi:hypothetical protein
VPFRLEFICKCTQIVVVTYVVSAVRTMFRQLNHFNVSRPRPAGGMHFPVAGLEREAKSRRGGFANRSGANKFPRRPDAEVISETIPLFYIGQNRRGFWVAREAERRSGGLFIFKRSALRFAQKKCAPIGCATMFVADAFELDIENEGNDLVGSMSVIIDAATRRAPSLVDFIGSMVGEWRKLVVEVSRSLAGERRNRAAIERELFCGQYRLSSKNDDDLPIP